LDDLGERSFWTETAAIALIGVSLLIDTSAKGESLMQADINGTVGSLASAIIKRVVAQRLTDEPFHSSK
jgi:hypothetical protein